MRALFCFHITVPDRLTVGSPFFIDHVPKARVQRMSTVMWCDSSGTGEHTH
eukprot:m.1661306 g.1661306  ORF g.1661306 m.1661306 type:complete len:51 (-) comp124559_c0_seq1:40-192(-)